MQNIIKKIVKTTADQADQRNPVIEKRIVGKQGRWRMFRHGLDFFSRVNNSMQAGETKSSSNVQQRLGWIYQLPNTHTAV